jgi:hypothetical protein
MHKIGDFIVEYLREFEVLFKMALTRVSGSNKGSCFMKIKPDVENLVSGSLQYYVKNIRHFGC